MPDGGEILSARVLDWVRQHNLNPDQAAGEIQEDTDLLSAGVLDSIAFIELITYIEAEAGYQVDIAQADPDDFATVAGLCRFAMNSRS